MNDTSEFLCVVKNWRKEWCHVYKRVRHIKEYLCLFYEQDNINIKLNDKNMTWHSDSENKKKLIHELLL